MTEQPFSNREIQEMFSHIKEDLKGIKEQTTLTNGKVRRLYIYLVGVAGLAIGLGIVETKTVLALLA